MTLQKKEQPTNIYSIFRTNVIHIIRGTDFPLFCSNFGRKCLILPAECSPQKSLILLEILPAEFIQAYQGSLNSFQLTSSTSSSICSRGSISCSRSCSRRLVRTWVCSRLLASLLKAVSQNIKKYLIINNPISGTKC